MSRTCVTEPGEEATSGSTRVWMESTTTSAGDSSSMADATAPTCVSDSSHSPGSMAPSRPARSRTCAPLSSPET